MADTKFGSITPSDMKIGSSQVSAIYQGNSLVWSAPDTTSSLYINGSGHLQCDMSGGAFDTADYIVYDFRKDGTSIANANFGIAESGGTNANTYRDYSSNAYGFLVVGSGTFSTTGAETNSGSTLQELTVKRLVDTTNLYNDPRGQSKYSMFFRVKFDAFTTNAVYTVQETAVKQFSLIIETTGLIRYRVGDTVVNDANTSTGVLTTGSWYDIVAVYDGTQATATDRIKIYVNGVSQSLSFINTIPTTIPNYTVAFSNIMNYTAYFDQAIFYKGIALTATQASQWYNGGTYQSNVLASDMLEAGTYVCRAVAITNGVASSGITSNSVVVT